MDNIANVITTFNGIIADLRNGKIKTRDGFECSACYNSGYREVPDPQGSNYRGVVRCNMCRYWEFERQRIAAKS